MNDIFVNEDISKPENRVNLAIFHLLMVDDFHNWFCDKLDLPMSSIIYPTENLSGDRPDMIIKDDDKTLGYIEVELGDENNTQLKKYRSKYESDDIHIYSITGRQKHSSNLGLDEIEGYFSKYQKYSNEQTKLSVHYLVKLIQTCASNSASYSRNPVSEEVHNSPFVSKLLNALSDYKPDNLNRVVPGSYYCDTNGPKGFSFRVYSQKATQKSLSLLSISNGRDCVAFLSADKYRHYLDHKDSTDISNWIEFITKELRLPIDKNGFNGRIEIPIKILIGNFESLVKNIIPLI